MAVVENLEHSANLENLEEPNAPQNATNEDTQAGAQSEGANQGTEPNAAAQSARTTVPEDHPTKLGRRVSRMEDRMTDMFDKLDLLLSRVDSGVPTRIPEYPDQLDQEDVPEHVKETVAAVKRELARDSQRDIEIQQKYATDYIRAIQNGFGETDEELHNAVVKELTETNFRNYKKHTGDAKRDAEINYDRAVAAVLRRNRATSRVAPNVRGDRQNASTDLSTVSRLGEPPAKKIALDEYSRKFLAAIGAKEDDPWVLESLKASAGK